MYNKTDNVLTKNYIPYILQVKYNFIFTDYEIFASYLY